MNYVCYCLAPLGRMALYSDGTRLIGLYFEGSKHFGEVSKGIIQEAELPIFEETKRWLDVYFSGRNPSFIPPISLRGTPFQLKVWEALLSVPYGSMASYQQIGGRVEDTKRVSCQAIGKAIGRNPIALIVPCHRVIRKDGGLGGYAAGIDKKKHLLELEGVAFKAL